MKIQLINENSLMLYFSEQASIEVADEIAAACTLLRQKLGDRLIDAIPSYISILLSCDLLKTNLRAFEADVYAVMTCFDPSQSQPLKAAPILLPVYYGDEVALDGLEVSRYTDLSFAEIVTLHTSQTYRVFALGFAPGFAYLGHTPNAIAMPRKAKPRLKVPKGSVAIADRQTAVYPQASPGGWQVIGRTPLELFDVDKENLSQFEMGSQVRFESISRETFLAMGGQLGAVSEVDGR